MGAFIQTELCTVRALLLFCLPAVLNRKILLNETDVGWWGGGGGRWWAVGSEEKRKAAANLSKHDALCTYCGNR